MTLPLIALGMVGFLSATTQGPTAAVNIGTEMVVARQSMVRSLMTCALLDSGVSRMIAAPMYASLAALVLVPLPQRGAT